MIATMVMIPKADAFKWKLIAMIVTPYRIWAGPLEKMFLLG